MSLSIPRSRITHVLGGASLALGLIVALQLAFPSRPGDPADPAAAGGGDLAPLFETRQLPAPPEEAAVPEAPREPLLLVLEGVAISGDSRVALLRDPRGNNLVQVAEGAMHNGWTLESLEGGKAVFTRGDDVTELSIEVAPNPQAPQRRRPR
jgi:hypothetical protein